MTFKTIFSYLLLFSLILSCKQVYEVDVNQLKNETNRYHVLFINRNLSDNLGVIITDTNKREINLYYGDKNANGGLINVQQIVTYLPELKLLVNVEFDENLLPQRITSLKNDTTITIQFKNYNLKTNTVDIDIYDAQDVLLHSKEKVSCGDALLKFKEAKRQFDAEKGLRVAAGMDVSSGNCTGFNTFFNIISGAGCLLGAAGVVGTALSIPTGIGIPIFAVSLASTVLSCKTAYNDITNQWNGRCLEPIDWEDNVSLDITCLAILKEFAKGNRIRTIFQATQCITGVLDAFARVVNEKIDNLSTPSNTPTVFYEGGKSFGDPNIVTFDGKSYGFNGVGEFIAVKSLTDNFEIQVRQEELKNLNSSGSVSWNTGLAINTGSDRLCFYPTKYFINQTPYNYSSNIDNTLSNGGNIRGNIQAITVSTGTGDIVKIFNQNDALDYAIIPSAQRQGKMIGVFGNYDGRANNDLQIRNGSQIDGSYATLYPGFTNSWRIAQSQSLFVYDTGKNTSSYTDTSFPRTPLVITASQRASAEQICRNAGVVAPFLEGCINDVVATGDNSMANRSKKLQDERTLRSFDILFGPNDDKSLISNRINSNLYGTDYVLCDNFYPIIERPVHLINGFETTIYFASEKPEPRTAILSSRLGIGFTNDIDFSWVIDGGQGYDYNDISNFNASLDPKLFIFDGKKHKVVIQSIINISTNKMTSRVLFDDVLVLEKKDVKIHYYDAQSSLLKNTNVTLILGWTNAPKVKLYRWSFKSL
ncbi:VWD domain-containing protein [Runella slithyformis]|uniref:von Willebrand factor type D protein n=1 Tax=Runella slithyformis (strain ATCC 29530 / DSM 19594 / LMG 11500 / NCIMB 11436 / LSU 4) TaxID=761193 RepID=A0A7U4E6Q9_RUNSL|nr:VWD domain-containing protein [Runella slithyformis]AEI49599.1 von Willebrand factor type D protein [Runella slithyformis DSM 19594]